MTRVLVVDDEIDTLNLLRTILEISGYQAVTTLNSLDAITLAEIEQPQCILLDIMMPHLDGFTLCKMMRLHPATHGLPIIFVTAYSALDLEDRRRDAGANLVLPKPVGMDTLVEAIESVLKQQTASKVVQSTTGISHSTSTASPAPSFPKPVEKPAVTAPVPPVAASKAPEQPSVSSVAKPVDKGDKPADKPVALPAVQMPEVTKPPSIIRPIGKLADKPNHPASGPSSTEPKKDAPRSDALQKGK